MFAAAHRVLGVFPRTRWMTTDPRREDRSRATLSEILDGTCEPAPNEAALVAVLTGASMLRIIVPSHEFTGSRARAKRLPEGNWASAAVRTSVAATQAATAAAIAASASSGT
ncbi:hypothetical protein ABH922_004322 [Rhodococcus sp. 27YEA15]